MRFESKIRRITKAQIHWTISDHVQFQPIIPLTKSHDLGKNAASNADNLDDQQQLQSLQKVRSVSFHLAYRPFCNLLLLITNENGKYGHFSRKRQKGTLLGAFSYFFSRSAAMIRFIASMPTLTAPEVSSVMGMNIPAFSRS